MIVRGASFVPEPNVMMQVGGANHSLRVGLGVFLEEGPGDPSLKDT